MLKAFQKNIENSQVANSVGLAFLGRLGAMVELISLPLFAWLYGVSTLGIFFTLWSAVKVLTTLTECAMSTTLQRFVPKATTAQEPLQAIKLAIITGTCLSLLTAMFIYLNASNFASFFNAGQDDATKLTKIVKLYIWILPLWTLVEILTSTIRATRNFGPEIRIRVFYEQGLRIIAGVFFFVLGFLTFGLFYAHIASVLIAFLLSIKLLSKHYVLANIFSAKLELGRSFEMLSFAIFMAPATLIKRANSELPLLFLNMVLPGADGANAAAIYGVGRKITSILQVIRQSFDYVIAPFTTHMLNHSTRVELEDMFGFSSRIILGIVLPLSAFMVATRADIISLFSSEFMATSSVIFILIIGRVLEAITGPASSIIEMIGHKALPFLNGVLGLMTLTGIMFYLDVDQDVTLAAIAGASGLIMPAFLSLIEGLAIYKLNPFRPKGYFKVLIIALTTSIAILSIIPIIEPQGHTVSFLFGLVLFFLSLVLIIRYGFSKRDVKALGKLGKWFGKNEIN